MVIVYTCIGVAQSWGPLLDVLWKVNKELTQGFESYLFYVPISSMGNPFSGWVLPGKKKAPCNNSQCACLAAQIDLARSGNPPDWDTNWEANKNLVGPM